MSQSDMLIRQIYKSYVLLIQSVTLLLHIGVLLKADENRYALCLT